MTMLGNAAGGSGSPRRPKIAVIGGGAAGLAAARVLTRYHQQHQQQQSQGTTNQESMPSPQVTVFERERHVGGIWKYQPNSSSQQQTPSSKQARLAAVANKQSPMYRNLRTNLPKEIMAFREYPWASAATAAAAAQAASTTPCKLEKETASFVTHFAVQDYLQSYSHTFGLDQYVHEGCNVTQLTVLSDHNNESLYSSQDEPWPKIQLEWTTTTTTTTNSVNGDTKLLEEEQQQQQEGDSRRHQDIFDAVCVCNGHFARPAWAPIPGLQEHFRGRVLHSVSYDEPSPFTNLTVLCMGGRASGSDVAREIATVAKQVYLSDTTVTWGETESLQNITRVPKTIQVLEDGSILFDHDCPVTPHVDVIIFCTGYDYDFPFVNEQSNLELSSDQRRVTPLYEQLWHATHPNICFIGLPHSVLPFPTFELQAEAALHQWNLHASHDTAVTGSTLPPRAAREAQAARDAVAGGEGKPGGRVPQDTHYLGPAQWDYCRRLSRLANNYDDEMENYLSTNQTIYQHTGKARQLPFPAGPDLYRDELRYRRNNAQQSFALV